MVPRLVVEGRHCITNIWSGFRFSLSSYGHCCDKHDLVLLVSDHRQENLYQPTGPIPSS